MIIFTIVYVKQNIIVNFIIQKLKNKHTFSQKVYKLSKAKFSRFEGTRGDKNQIFRTLAQENLVNIQGSYDILNQCLWMSATP
jgi:hypothetical protein